MLTKIAALTLSSLLIISAAHAAAPEKATNLLFADKAKADKAKEERSKASDAQHEDEEEMDDQPAK